MTFLISLNLRFYYKEGNDNYMKNLKFLVSDTTGIKHV